MFTVKSLKEGWGSSHSIVKLVLRDQHNRFSQAFAALLASLTTCHWPKLSNVPVGNKRRLQANMFIFRHLYTKICLKIHNLTIPKE